MLRILRKVQSTPPLIALSKHIVNIHFPNLRLMSNLLPKTEAL